MDLSNLVVLQQHYETWRVYHKNALAPSIRSLIVCTSLSKKGRYLYQGGGLWLNTGEGEGYLHCVAYHYHSTEKSVTGYECLIKINK
jgi:hypothetical protein